MEVLEAPRYNPTTAARLVQLSQDRVTRWLRGYRFTYQTYQGERQSKKPPVIQRRPAQWKRYASFLDLIDLLFIKQFLEAGISLQTLRKALKEATELLDGYHFAQRYFFTDGERVYLDLKNHKEEARELFELLSNGKWVIAPVITQVAEQISFDETTGYAERWFPMGPEKPIMLDPGISFGRPAIVGRGISTANIYDMYVAEDQNYEVVCDWMQLQRDEVTAAVKFEEYLRGNEVLHRQ